MDKLLVVFGTRPELIKLTPVIWELSKQRGKKSFVVLNTGQHADLTTADIVFFGIEADYTFKREANTQDLDDLASSLMRKIKQVITREQKQGHTITGVIAEGDTSTVFASSLVAFFNQIPFHHVEAGLRTYDLQQPFPEEFIRRSVSLSASYHYAPTLLAKKRLEKEGIDAKRIFLTGNPIVDILEYLKVKTRTVIPAKVPRDFLESKRLVLITCHRRENFGHIPEIIRAVKSLALQYPHLRFLWILHPNPAVRKNFQDVSWRGYKNIHITEPLHYHEMIALYRYVKIIISDSGGIQEEAPSFGIPVVVIRKVTERVESLVLGSSVLASIHKKDIERKFTLLLRKKIKMGKNPYGNGKAAQKIAKHILRVSFGKRAVSV